MGIEQAKMILASLPGLYSLQKHEEEAISAVINALENIIDWIPVSERLPNVSGRYYVTERVYCGDDIIHNGQYFLRTNSADYDAAHKKWIRAPHLVVVAWMENKPYTEGISEHENPAKTSSGRQIDVEKLKKYIAEKNARAKAFGSVGELLINAWIDEVAGVGQ